MSEEELAAYRVQEQGRVRGMAAQETEARVELLRRSREVIVGKIREHVSTKLNGKIIQENREQEEGHLT